MLIVTSAYGQDGLRISAPSRGLSLVGRQNTWGVHYLTATNESSEDRNLRVQLDSSSSSEGRRVYSITTTVPAGSARRLVLPAELLSLGTEESRKPFWDKGKPFPAELTFTLWDADTNQRLGMENKLVNVLRPDVTAVCWISDPDTATISPADDYIDELKEEPLGDVQKVSLTQRDLPERWFAYSSIDIILLDAIRVDQINPNQLMAMLDWVRQGGTMVLVGSTHLPQMLTGELAEAAGVVASGHHEIDRLDATQLEVTNPSEFIVDFDAPVPVVELEPTSAQVLYTGNDLPLLTRNVLGEGQVLTLAVPFRAIRDEQAQAVWHTVGRSRNVLPPVAANQFLSPARETLVKIAGRRGPDRIVPVTIILIVALLVIAFGIVARFRRRGELVWLILIPAAVLLGVVLYFVGSGSRESDRLTHVGLITQSDDGKSRVEEVYAFYSGEGNRTVTFAADDAQELIKPLGQAASDLMSETKFSFDPVPALPEQTVRVNSTRAFYINGMDASPAVTGTVTFGPEGLVATLTNRLPKPITQAVLYANQQTYRVGELPAGQETTITISENDRLGAVAFDDASPDLDEFTANRVRRWIDQLGSSDAGTRRTALARLRGMNIRAVDVLLEEMRKAVARNDRRTESAIHELLQELDPTIVPYNPNAEKTKRLDRVRDWRSHFRSKGPKLARGEFTPVPLYGPTAKLRNRLVGRVLAAPRQFTEVSMRPMLLGYVEGSLRDPVVGADVPHQGWSVLAWPMQLSAPERGARVRIPGGLVDRRLRGSVIWNPMTREFMQPFQSGSLYISIAAPEAVGRLEETTATLFIKPSAVNFRLTLFGVTPEGQTVQLDSWDNPGDLQTVTVDNADRFQTPEGRYQFEIKAQNISESSSVADVSSQWTLERVDVALEGINQ
ncbi:MAG: hypothetical protein ACLFVU_04485 [Phycisphaerae bacterium]